MAAPDAVESPDPVASPEAAESPEAVESPDAGPAVGQPQPQRSLAPRAVLHRAAHGGGADPWACGAGSSARPWARWLGALVLAAALAYALGARLAFLDAKPLHHDEGVNAHFLHGLVTAGRYHYDPTNYHGPFLYFAGAAPFAAWGATPLGLRLLPALTGALTILLLIPLRRVLGWAGVACAAWLLALSPIATYVSRTAIHEAYFVFAVLGAVAAGVAWVERPRRGPLVALGLMAALAYANKETAVISYAAYGCGILLALLLGRELRGWPLARLSWLWRGLRGAWGQTRLSWLEPVPHWVPGVAFLLAVAWSYLLGVGLRLLWFRGAASEVSQNSWAVWERLTGLAPAALVGTVWVLLTGLCAWLLWGLVPELRRWWDEQPTSRRPIWLALLACGVLTVVLFSSLASSVTCLVGLLASLYHWIKRGLGSEKTGHEHAFPYYFELLWRFEAPLVVLAVPGALVALLRRRALELFLLGWAGSTVLVYSILKYKTPWLVLNLVVPLALLAGLGVGALGSWLGRRSPRGLLEGVLAVACVALLVAPAVPPEPPRKLVSWEPERWPTLVAGPVEQGPEDWRAPEGEPGRDRPKSAWWRVQWSLNVLSPDDDRYGPVYAQTDRGALALFRRLQLELESGRSLTVTAGEYWPLPAYLYPHRAGYLQAVPERLESDLYLIGQDQDRQAAERFRGWGRSSYPLRTGVTLVLRSRPEQR